MASTTVGIKLNDETRKRLQKLGEIKQRSSHWLTKAAIRAYQDREEVHERERIEHAERWERFIPSDLARRMTRRLATNKMGGARERSFPRL